MPSSGKDKLAALAVGEGHEGRGCLERNSSSILLIKLKATRKGYSSSQIKTPTVPSKRAYTCPT